MAETQSSSIEPNDPSPPKAVRLVDVAAVFLRLGLTAFGGPAAHIAMLENEVVIQRRWVSHDRFLDMLGAANLIPGPSSSELAIFVGYEVAGLPGLVLAGCCFIAPAALMTGAIGWAYVHFGTLPSASGVLYGIKPVVIAIVLQALWGLAPKAIKRSYVLAAIGAIATVAAVTNQDVVLVLIGAGVTTMLVRSFQRRNAPSSRHGWLWLAPLGLSATTSAASIGLGSIFLVFLKLGSIVFGSGYVLVVFLRSELVDRLHWISEAQLIDAVAVGQVTPGPVFTTATFLGYLLAGGWGALVATVGIFLPGFVLIAAIRPLIDRVRSSPTMGAFLDGVNVASLALMAVVSAQVGRAALVDALTIAIAVTSAVALVRFKMNSTWLIAAGAIVGAVSTSLKSAP